MCIIKYRIHACALRFFSVPYSLAFLNNRLQNEMPYKKEEDIRSLQYVDLNAAWREGIHVKTSLRGSNLLAVPRIDCWAVGDSLRQRMM